MSFQWDYESANHVAGDEREGYPGLLDTRRLEFD
jgi:hypothetical protein